MEMLKKLVFFLFSLVIAYSQINAQKIPLSFRQLSIDQGLSCSNVEHITEDSLGYMWFGGPQGLNRFDGYEVRNYYSSLSDSTSIPENQILSLHCDIRGYLWVGTRDGIARYNYAHDNFERYHYSEEGTNEYNLGLVACIDEDHRNRLWFSTQNGHFFKYNEEENQFYPGEIRVNEILQVESFYFDERDTSLLWIGTDIGLIKYQLDSDKYKIIEISDDDADNLLSKNIHCILPKGEYLWLGVYRVGFVRLNRNTDEFSVFSMETEGSNYILGGAEDSRGNIWFATAGGLYLWDSANQKFHNYVYSEVEENGLTATGTASIYEDSNHNYWVGMGFGGVNYSWGQENFRSYSIDPNNERHLPEERVNSIFLDDKNQLWCLYSSGIDVFDRKSMRHLKSFAEGTGKALSLGSGTIWTAVQDDEKRIWVTTYTGGLQQYLPEKDVFVSYPNVVGNKEIGQDIRDIYIDEQGDLWLTMHGNGFSRFDPETGEFHNYQVDKSRSYLDWTYCIHVDSDKNIWVGTTSGLFKFDQDVSNRKDYFLEKNDPNSLSYNAVNTIFEDSGRNIWIGTSRGLNLYVPQIDGFKRISIECGLENDNICAIEEDNDGNLWVSTRGGGIFTFSPREWLEEGKFNYRQFDKSDGLQSDEFAERASLKDENGYMYFGGVDGFTIFHPDSLRKNPNAPKVLISEVILFDEVIFPSSDPVVEVKTDSLSMGQELVLNHNQNVLALKFIAFNYRQPEKNEYLYTMEGFDNRWYSARTNREAVYTNLPPGEYVFKVKASNNDGVWSKEQAEMNITVLPPWWQTSWFRFLLVFFFVGVLYAFFLWRVKAIKRQRNILGKMVKKKTAQLERQNKEIKEMSDRVHEADQSKIRFFMNISHEFRTPLSLILGPLNNLLGAGDLSDFHKKQLQFINRSAHRLMRLINQLLDMQKVDMNKLTLKVSEVDVVDFMRSIFHLFEFNAREKGIIYTFNFKGIEKGQKQWLDIDALEKIIYNLLSNAFKHTLAGGEVEVAVALKGERLLVTVKDSGAGIPPEKINRIFDRYFSRNSFGGSNDGIGIGLTLVKELVKLHKGTIDVKSELGKGTEFIVELPAGRDGFNHEDILTGEEIKKRMPADSPVIISREKSIERAHSQWRVLLVEDDEDLLHFLKNDLQNAFKLQTAMNGAEGWKMARKFQPDLIVSDLMMPVMDGMELCQKIKSDDELGHIPFIMLTAKSGADDIISGYSVGADDYITKPFNSEVLKARVLNLLESRKKLRQRFDSFADIKLPSGNGGDEGDKFLDKVINYIENNIANTSLGHKEICSELSISKTKLYAKVGELTGYSINIFIRIIRLRRAAFLLENSEYSVSEVAYQVGFSDPNYFSKCFKEHFKVSPRDYAAGKSVED
jgi:signal transduction histidine kinase/ligand-binding sensor domain-containing protein/AraC-like DNA-binding protein